jgi:hypothetical protein
VLDGQLGMNGRTTNRFRTTGALDAASQPDHNLDVTNRRSSLWKWIERKRWWLFLALILVAAPLALFVLPPILVSSHGLTAASRLEAENAVRGTLLQAIGGAVVFAGLYLTWRTFDLNRQGQVTERFTRAVDQLGDEKIEVRTGGIFALERIAWDSERDHGPVMEVLTAFINARAPWRDDLPQGSAPSPGKIRPPPDIRAALTVIGRRDRRRDDLTVRLRFHEVDLRGASLRGGQFQGVRLRRSHLENARLEGAQLQGAKLRGARLDGADFGPDADLDLASANLEGASLAGAELDGAKLEGASLRGAHLEGANLSTARLEGADFHGAYCDALTTWPDPFDRKTEGVIWLAISSCRICDQPFWVSDEGVAAAVPTPPSHAKLSQSGQAGSEECAGDNLPARRHDSRKDWEAWWRESHDHVPLPRIRDGLDSVQ